MTCQSNAEECFDRNLPFTASKQKSPIMLGLPGLGKIDSEDKRTLVSGLHQCLDNSAFDYSREGSIGMFILFMLYFFPNCLYKIYSSGLIPPSLQNTMQWFAVTLLNGRLPYLKPSETPILVETTEDDLLLTFAASDVSRILNSTVMRHRKVEVFGDPWDLVTVKCVSCPRDGDVLLIADCAGCRTWACCGRGRSCSPTTSPPRRWPPAPASTPWWTGGGTSGGTGGSWSHLVSWGSESSAWCAGTTSRVSTSRWRRSRRGTVPSPASECRGPSRTTRPATPSSSATSRSCSGPPSNTF